MQQYWATQLQFCGNHINKIPMKKSILLPLFFGISSIVFGQLTELQNAQEVRKKYIDPSKSDVSFKRMIQKPSVTKYVNPFIGTGGHGHTFPGAAAPFGMVQLSPDTRYDGWDGCSGYHYSDSIIYGFSFTHLSGTGVPDLCDLLIVPQQGKALTTPGYLSKNGYGSLFKHSEEKASPGMYEVKLQKNNIDVQLLATERAGFLSFTFNEAKGKKYILIDLDHRDQLLDANFDVKSNQIIAGYRHSNAWAKNQKFFFYLELDVPFTKKTIISKGNQHKLLLEFPEETKKIQVKSAISAVDATGAELNLKQEIPDWSTVRLNYLREVKWQTELSKIDFQSNEAEVMTNFYTAVYHAYLCPTLFTDADGRFLGNDGKIYNYEDKLQYSVFSLWDTYRAAHPLYTLTQTKRTEDFIESFLRIYKQTNDLPVWELVGNETDCMIGYHSVSVILDAYRKGINEFDVNLALKAMIQTSTINELGKKQYAENGYLGTNIEPESVSKTLEYAYDDWCIAQFAKEIGNDSIAKIYENRSYNFLNVFDPETKFMRARRGGQWFAPFNPAEVNFNYTEANSWQYSLAAPQHISTLRSVLGGKDSLQTWLDRLFSTESKLEGRHQVDITGLIGQYAHGNEPSHHMAYLYNYTNQPFQTQEKVDQILREMYHNAPDGLAGNEDCGQMSAWYVLSAMGIYPVCPGSPTYAIGRPLQKYATIHFENGKSFTIRTEDNSPEHKYIYSMKLNGAPYEKLYLDHQTMLNGGELVIIMTDKPNPVLVEYKREIIENEIIPTDVIPVPYFTQTKRTFLDSITTEINFVHLNTKSNYKIVYTTDGTEPTFRSAIYQKPLTFSKTTNLKVAIFIAEYNHTNGILDGSVFVENSNLLGKSVSSTFNKSNNNISLQLETQFANQYAASGENALIDGIRSGSTDFRSGDWQGFEGVDAKGILNFEKPQTVRKISVSCLQDEHSWIFFPTEFQVFTSEDGINFKPNGTIQNSLSPAKKGNLTQNMTVEFNTSTPFKAIKFVIKNRQTCPEGHISAGERAWIFLDEVVVE
jgi:predicted alpha-1,2-mannosidase